MTTNVPVNAGAYHLTSWYMIGLPMFTLVNILHLIADLEAINYMDYSTNIRTMLISASGGRFPRARLQPIEQRRVRFAVFLRSLQKLRHSCPCSQRYAFARKSRSS